MPRDTAEIEHLFTSLLFVSFADYNNERASEYSQSIFDVFKVVSVALSVAVVRTRP